MPLRGRYDICPAVWFQPCSSDYHRRSRIDNYNANCHLTGGRIQRMAPIKAKHILVRKRNGNSLSFLATASLNEAFYHPKSICRNWYDGYSTINYPNYWGPDCQHNQGMQKRKSSIHRLRTQALSWISRGAFFESLLFNHHCVVSSLISPIFSKFMPWIIMRQ